MSSLYEKALANAKKMQNQYSEAKKADLRAKANEQKTKKKADQKAKKDKLKKANNKTATTPNGHTVIAGGRKQLTPEAKDYMTESFKKIPEAVKKNVMGSSYVAPDGSKPKTIQGTAIYQKGAKQESREKLRKSGEKVTPTYDSKVFENVANEKGISGTFGRTLTGVGKGFVDSTLGLPSAVASAVSGKDIDLRDKTGLNFEPVAELMKDSRAFKVGEIGGNLLGYGAQNIAAAPVVNSIVSGTKIGSRADAIGNALSKTKLGKLAGEEASKRFAQDMARELVESQTIGRAQNIGIASMDGKEGLDFIKDVELNNLLDLGAGTVFNSIPFALSVRKGAKAAKAAKKIDIDSNLSNTTKKAAKTGNSMSESTLPDAQKFNQKTVADIQDERLNELAEQIKKADAEAKSSARVTQTNKRVKNNNANRTARANAKSQELLDEYIKVQNMTPDEYAKYAGIETPNVDTGSQVKMDTSAVKESDAVGIGELTPEAKQRLYNSIEKRSGVKIVEEDLEGRLDGYYENGVIHIKKNATSSHYTVLKHELTHMMQTSDMYEDFANFIFDNLQKRGYDLNELRELKKAHYFDELHKELSPTEVDQELIAEFCGEFLFNSEESIERLARENPSLFRRIYEWIVDTIKKIGADEDTKFLIDAQRKYEKVLKTADATIETGMQPLFVRATKQEMELAKEMERNGATPEEIKEKLNLHRGFKRHWLYEVDDSKARINYDAFENGATNIKDALLKKGNANIRDVLDHPELWERLDSGKKKYKIDDVEVNLEDLGDYTYGQVVGGKKITLNKKISQDEQLGTLLHETQHAIQRGSNLPHGASPDFYKVVLKDEKFNIARADYQISIGKVRDSVFEILNEYERICGKLPTSFHKIKSTTQTDLYGEQLAMVLDLAENKMKNENKLTDFSAKVNKARRELLNAIAAEEYIDREAFKAYKNTAGEIEARDVTDRRYLTSELRRKIYPESGKRNKDVVFAEDYEPQFSVSGQESFDKNSKLYERSKNLYGETGNKYIADQIKKPVGNTPRLGDLTPEAKQKLYSNIKKRSGLKIVEEELPDNIEGFFEGDTIHVNKKSASTGFTVLKHELTHHIESSEDYKAFSDFVVKGMKDNGFDVDAIKNEIKDFYDGNLGKQLTDDEALKEVVANFSGEYLFNSEKSIERLSRENPGLFRRIYDWIVDTIHKFGKDDSTKFLIDAQRKYEKALRSANININNGRKYQGNFDKKIQLGNKSDFEYVDLSKVGRSADGEYLSKEQMDFFKDSVVRNSNGELIPLYHTTPDGGWTVPNIGYATYSPSRSSGLFMSSDKNMTLGYDWRSGERVDYSKANIAKAKKTLNSHGTYKFYARFKKPFVIDAKGAVWNEIAVDFDYVAKNSDISLSYNTTSQQFELSIIDKKRHEKPIVFEGVELCDLADEILDKYSADEVDDLIARLNADGNELSHYVDAMTIYNPADPYSDELAEELMEKYFKDGKSLTGELAYNWDEDAPFSINTASTDEIVNWAMDQIADNGKYEFDSVIIKNVQDYAANKGFDKDSARDVYVAFRPSQVKFFDNKNPTLSRDIRYMGANKMSGRNEPLYFTSKNLYGETGNKYINEGKNLPKGKTKADKTLPTKTEQAAKANKLKSVSADAKNPDYEMTYEQASKMYDNYKNGTPVKLPGKGDVSKAADTVIGSDYISDEMRTALKDNVDNYVKTTKSNKVTLDNVNAKIDEKGLTPTLKAFQKLIPKGKMITEEDIATGAELIRRLDEKGKYEEALDVADDLIEMMSQAGRTLQAANIFASMTPYGKIRSVRKAAENMSNRYGKKVAVDETLLKKLFEEKDPAKADKIKQSIFLDLWNQVPPTLMEKLDAIRYTAMLSSPKTHLRNIFGNTAMYVGKELSDAVETALEKSLFKGKMEKVGALRNKTVLNPLSAEDMALKKKAGELFEDIKDTILNHDVKYIEKGNMRPQDSPVFKGKALEGARKFVSGTLEYEDEIFMKINFQNAFAKICKANGLEAGELTPREIRQFTAYATQQAQTATFRDANALATAMNKVYRYAADTKNSDFVGKIGKGMLKTAMDATVPFKKTPANVLKQGWRYSPGGLIEGMARCISAKDADSLMKGIEILSNGIVGTPVLLAGFFMAKEGFVNGNIGNYSDKDTKYKKMLGQQDYSVTVGDKTITMDWLSPYSMPFFVGVELASALEDNNLTGTELVDALAGITNPFLEMSMLQGLQSLITANYEENAAQTLIQNTLKSYVAQFIPSISQQFAKTIAKTTTTTSRVNDGTSSGKFIKGTAAQLKSKVPGLYGMNEPDVDMWGRTDTKEDMWDYVNAGLRNIVSPSNIKDMNVTTVDKEILRLYDNLDDEQNAVIPTPASSKVEYKGNEYRMTDKEFTQYKKDLGQYRYKELEKLFKTAEYKSANIEGKADMVKAVYKKANDVAKKNFLIKSGKMTKEEYAMSTIESKGAIKAINSGKTTAVKVASARDELEASSAGKKGILQAYALIGKYDADTIKAVGGMNSNGGYKISDNTINEARNLKNSGVGLSEIQQIYVKANVDGNGAVSKAEAMAYLSTTNYSREQKRAIFDALMSHPNTKNPY